MATTRNVDVVIIGGGPAGSVCGYQLKQAGVECLIVDRATFPRDKICGGGLTPKAWRLLDRLMPGVSYDYRPVWNLRLQFDKDPVCEFDAEYELRMTNRKDFDYSLLKHYMQHGGEVLQDAFDRYEVQADGRLTVNLKSGTRISCRYLVAADGAHSRVRKQMFGDYAHNVFFIEQYTEESEPKNIISHFSSKYFPGCFYKFPGIGRDVWGFNGPVTDREHFQRLMADFGVPQGRIVGGYIPMKTVQSTHEHIIFIGDAGGFPNRITGEGLYDAFQTAFNAKRAIVEQRPFSETNRQVFVKMHAQDRLFRFANTALCRLLFRMVLRHPRWAKWLFDTKMKREYWMR